MPIDKDDYEASPVGFCGGNGFWEILWTEREVAMLPVDQSLHFMLKSQIVIDSMPFDIHTVGSLEFKSWFFDNVLAEGFGWVLVMSLAFNNLSSIVIMAPTREWNSEQPCLNCLGVSLLAICWYRLLGWFVWYYCFGRGGGRVDKQGLDIRGAIYWSRRQWCCQLVNRGGGGYGCRYRGVRVEIVWTSFSSLSVYLENSF